MLLKRRQPDEPAAALNKFCSICTLNGVYTEFGIDLVLSHYAGYIRYFSKVHGQVNAEVEDYVKQQLIAALFKFRFDR